MGGYTIVEFYFRAEYPWIGYILLGILLLVAGLGFYLFKKDDKRVCVITEKEMTSIRYLLYGYFIVYVIEMILPSLIKTINLEFLTVTTGVVLILIAIVGTVIQLNILKSSKK